MEQNNSDYKKTNTKEDKKISDIFYTIKGLAIISVVLAHSGYTNVTNVNIKSICSAFAMIGVIAFLFIAGYYFNYEKYNNIFQLIKKKIITIGIPWIITGLYIYGKKFFYIPVYFDLKEIINYLLGNGTYLYYLTILSMCYLLFFLLPKKTYIYMAFIFLCVTSLFMTAHNIIPLVVDPNKWPFTYINPYLNIFNWIGFFALGMFIKNKNLLDKIINIMDKKMIFIIIFPIIIAILSFFYQSFHYFQPWNITIEILGLFFLLELSIKINNFKLLKDIGKSSFSIYLLHFLLIGKFNLIFPTNILFALVRPIIVVLLLYFYLKTGKEIAKTLKLEKLYNTLIGLR